MTWAPDYVDMVNFRAFVNVDDTNDDTELGVALTSASRAIDDHCNRQFGRTAGAEERFYTAWYDYERRAWVVDVDDFMSVVDLSVSIVDVGAVTTFVKEPINAAAKGKPWERLLFTAASEFQPTGAEHEISVTANPWGWSAVPVPVEQATLLQGSRFAARRSSPYGVAGSPENGSELRLLSRVDPDVAVSLRGLRRTRRVG